MHSICEIFTHATICQLWNISMQYLVIWKQFDRGEIAENMINWQKTAPIISIAHIIRIFT